MVKTAVITDLAKAMPRAESPMLGMKCMPDPWLRSHLIISTTEGRPINVFSSRCSHYAEDRLRRREQLQSPDPFCGTGRAGPACGLRNRCPCRISRLVVLFSACGVFSRRDLHKTSRQKSRCDDERRNSETCLPQRDHRGRSHSGRMQFFRAANGARCTDAFATANTLPT